MGIQFPFCHAWRAGEGWRPSRHWIGGAFFVQAGGNERKAGAGIRGSLHRDPQRFGGRFRVMDGVVGCWRSEKARKERFTKSAWRHVWLMIPARIRYAQMMSNRISWPVVDKAACTSPWSEVRASAVMEPRCGSCIRPASTITLLSKASLTTTVSWFASTTRSALNLPAHIWISKESWLITRLTWLLRDRSAQFPCHKVTSPPLSRDLLFLPLSLSSAMSFSQERSAYRAISVAVALLKHYIPG
ncbi:hypothetical protein VTK56DRAFT_6523 [Thermocarpiscus australiensis]